MTETFNFKVSGFVAAGSPVNPWTGSFTITFDPGVASSGALGAFSSNLPASYGPPTSFTYSYDPSKIVPLAIGDNCGSAFLCSVSPDVADQAWISFDPVTASGGLTFDEAEISTASSTRVFEATTGTVTQTPLPATLPLFASGLAGLGLLGWRRKRKLTTEMV